MSLSLIYLISKAVSLTAFAAKNMLDSHDTGGTIIIVLAFSCLLLLDYLLLNLKKPKIIVSLAINLFIAVLCVVSFNHNLLFVMLFAVTQALDYILKGNHFYQSTVVVSALIVILIMPEPVIILISGVLYAMLILCRFVFDSLENTRLKLAQTRSEINAHKNKIGNLNAYVKTVKESAALEERSRFAVRIHDELGHSISGSIILLEAAKLNIDNNPTQAKQCIETATDNLRIGVDSIRKSLRQERPDIISVGITEIKKILDKHKSDYSMETHLEINGDEGGISYNIWGCIKENLTEALTNTLKHSESSVFTLKISVMKKLIRVEYYDNGKKKCTFKKGMGLTAIENRTEKAGGKCLFFSHEDGFHIVNIFNII